MACSIRKPWFCEARSSRWGQKHWQFLGSGVSRVLVETSASRVVFNRRDAPTPRTGYWPGNIGLGAAAGQNGAQELNLGLGAIWGSGRAGVRTSVHRVILPQPGVFRGQTLLSLLCLFKIAF